jgi:hypothetical protein
MTTATTASKLAVLHEARVIIASRLPGARIFLCHVISDAGRNTGEWRAASALRAYISAQLAPYTTLESWLCKQGVSNKELDDDLRIATTRLAWLDWMITSLETKDPK